MLKSIMGHNRLYRSAKLAHELCNIEEEGGVMRLSQLITRNVQKKILVRFKMLEGSKTCDIIGKFLSNGILPH